MAIDDTGKVVAVVTPAANINTSGDKPSARITLTVGNGRIKDQAGNSTTVSGQADHIVLGTTVTTNNEGQDVTSVSVGLSTDAGISANVSENRTEVVPIDGSLQGAYCTSKIGEGCP